MSSIESNICQAIDIIVNRAISKINYDKTILAQVIECVDATIGKYKIRYQDGTWYAYSSIPGEVYPVFSNVYVLIPEGDFSKTKMIIGSTDSKNLSWENIEYITDVEPILNENGEPIGLNLIKNSVRVLCAK